MQAGVIFLLQPRPSLGSPLCQQEQPALLAGSQDSEWGYHFCLLCKYLNGKWFNTTYGLIWRVLPGSCWLWEPHGRSLVEGVRLALTTPCQVVASSLLIGFTDWQEAPCCLLFLVCPSWAGKDVILRSNVFSLSGRAVVWITFSSLRHPLSPKVILEESEICY